MSIVDHLTLIGPTGTNKVMGGELSRLVKRAFDDVRLPEPQKEGQGALHYPFEARVAALAAQYHRTSSRVLWTLYQCRAARLEPLYGELFADIESDPRPWLRDGLTFSIEPGPTHEFAAGGRQLVGVAKNALLAAAERRGLALTVNPENPDLLLTLRVHEGVFSLAIDLAGGPMHLRGYRSEGGGAAPLRENLAAILVMLSRFDARSEALVDPMSGSGTIPIEAACMAQGRPVFSPKREPALKRLPIFADFLKNPPAPLFGDTEPLLFANELDTVTHQRAVANARRAGVPELVRFSNGDFRRLEPARIRAAAQAQHKNPDAGVILCNPPYGERLDPPDLRLLYRDLGEWCRGFPGWRAAFIVANPDFRVAFGGAPRIDKPLNNGPIKAWFYLYEMR